MKNDLGKWKTINRDETGKPWPEWAIRFECSACRLRTSAKSMFCPNCGADMRKEQKDEDQ